MSAYNQSQSKKQGFNEKVGGVIGHMIATTLAIPIAIILISIKKSWQVVVLPLLKWAAKKIVVAVSKKVSDSTTAQSAPMVRKTGLGLPTPACFQGHPNLAPAKEFKW